VKKTPEKKKITAVIVDLDNTLFDWVEMWSASFSAMLTRLVADSGVPQETLEREFRAIHQKYGTSEYAFSIEELPSLQHKFPCEDLAKKFDPAIHAYSLGRKKTLKLYPTVLETLQTLKAKGCLIIAYTESMAFYTFYRIRALGLDDVLDYLYSPEDHDLPSGLTPAQIRRYSPEEYKLHNTIHNHVPKGVLKPSPSVLLDILEDVGADRAETIYVGDSLIKDIVMAQQAGVTGVFAKYGVAQNRPEYELLRRVTHWTPDVVEKERRLSEAEAKPSHTLDQNFGQLLQFFSFDRFVEPIKNANDEEKKILVEIWKKTVDVQQHFNDIEMRIRNVALSVLVATLGGSGFALKEHIQIQALEKSVPLACLLLVAGLVVWIAFYFMDRFWYHQLLYGAVNHGIFIEGRTRMVLPELALTGAIGKASPIKIRGWLLHSPRKIDIFYLGVALVLVLLAIGSLFSGSPTAGPAGI